MVNCTIKSEMCVYLPLTCTVSLHAHILLVFNLLASWLSEHVTSFSELETLHEDKHN